MTKNNKPPAFQFYPKDWLSDSRVMAMTAEARGLYIQALCVDWLEDGIKEGQLESVCGLDRRDYYGNFRELEEIDEIMAQLSDCFSKHPTKPGFISNPRLQRERKSQEERRAERSQSGKRGAKARWNNNLGDATGIKKSHSSAIKEPMAKDASSSSSSSSSSSTNKKEKKYKKRRPKEVQKESYPDYPQLFFKPEELEKIKHRYEQEGLSYEEGFEVLDAYSKQSKNKSKFKNYASHYHVMIGWVMKEVRKRETDRVILKRNKNYLKQSNGNYSRPDKLEPMRREMAALLESDDEFSVPLKLIEAKKG